MSKRYQFLLWACVFTLAIVLAGTATAQTVIINEDFSGLPDGPATDPFTANHTWANSAGFGGGANAAINGETFEKVGDDVFIRWVSAITPVDLSAVTILNVQWDWLPFNTPQPGGEPDSTADHLWAIELSDSTNQGQEFFRFRAKSTVGDELIRIDSDQFSNVHQLVRSTEVELAEPNNIIKASDTYRVTAHVTQSEVSMTVTDITGGLPGTVLVTQTETFTGGLIKSGPEVWNQVEMSVLQGTLAACDNLFVGINGATPEPPIPTPTPIPPASVEEWSLYK